MTRSKSKAKAKKRVSMQGASPPSSSKQKIPSASTSSATSPSNAGARIDAEMLKDYLYEKIMSLKDDKDFRTAVEDQTSSVPEAFKDLVYGMAALALVAESDLPAVGTSAQARAGLSKGSKLPKMTFAVPQSYKSVFKMNASHRLKTDYPVGTMLFTTIPSRNITDPIDPDGHSEWWCDAATKAKVINAPAYLKPVPKPRSSSTSPAYLVKPTLKKGLGMFATRDIQMGELILAERPLLVAPRNCFNVMKMLDLDAYDDETQKAIVMMEWEQQLEIAVGRMADKDREAFMALANSHKTDGSGPILGIIRTNGFNLSGKLFDGEKRWDGGVGRSGSDLGSCGSETRRAGRADGVAGNRERLHCHNGGTNGYSGVVKIGSRINHSCMPNIEVDFSMSSFSLQFVASLDIKVGEELLFSYCEFDQSVAERRARLASYDIICDCPACTHTTPETDRLRKEYPDRAMDYMQKVEQWTSGGCHVVESMVDPVIEFKDALRREGLHFTSEYKSMVLMIQLFYEKLGLDEKAGPYREEYKRYKLDSEMINGVMVFRVPEDPY